MSRVNIGSKVGGGSDGAPFWAKYNDRLDSDTETLHHGLRELRALAAALEANDALVEQAAYLFRRAADDGLLVGLSIEAVAAGCLHVTGRERHAPLPLDQVGEASPVTVSDIKTAFSKLLREYDLQVAPPLPTGFIERFGSAAGLPTAIRLRARQLAESLIEEEAHVGQSPTGMAAAAIYGAAKESGADITQQELASIAFVSEVTLSRQWQTIQEVTEVTSSDVRTKDD